MDWGTQELVLSLVVAVVLLLALVLRLEIRLRKLLRGNRAKTVEESLELIERDLKSIREFRREVASYLAEAEKRLGRSIQGVGTVRFNPFKGDGSGGNQSFAASFVSEKGDGVVLSTLYSRDRMSVFAKPLKEFRSEYELSGEEKEAIKQAQQKFHS